MLTLARSSSVIKAPCFPIEISCCFTTYFKDKSGSYTNVHTGTSSGSIGCTVLCRGSWRKALTAKMLFQIFSKIVMFSKTLIYTHFYLLSSSDFLNQFYINSFEQQSPKNEVKVKHPIWVTVQRLLLFVISSFAAWGSTALRMKGFIMHLAI